MNDLKKYLKHIVLLVLLTSIIFLFGFSSVRNTRKKIKDIQVEFAEGINEFLTYSMVDKLLIQNKKSIKNQPKSVITLQNLENNILKNPYVENAEVFLTIDGYIKTKIKQRKPIARILLKNKIYYVDKYGVKIPLSSNYSSRVPLVTGVRTSNDTQQIIDLLSIIIEDNFFKKEIIGIQKTKTKEFVFNVRSGDYKIYFGKMKNVTTKFKKLKAFYNITFNKKIIKAYKSINLKYHNQVVCTKINLNGKQ